MRKARLAGRRIYDFELCIPEPTDHALLLRFNVSQC